MILVEHPTTGRVHRVSQNVANLLITQQGWLPFDPYPASTDRLMRQNRSRNFS